MAGNVQNSRARQRRRSQRGLGQGEPRGRPGGLQGTRAHGLPPLGKFFSLPCAQGCPGDQTGCQLAGAGPVPAARPEGPAIYHLKRVPELCPSSKHPYRGCWAADYGPQGLEVRGRCGPAAAGWAAQGAPLGVHATAARRPSVGGPPLATLWHYHPPCTLSGAGAAAYL